MVCQFDNNEISKEEKQSHIGTVVGDQYVSSGGRGIFDDNIQNMWTRVGHK